MEERIVAIDKFSQKMVNIGHTIKTVRSILISGIKGYKRRVARSVARHPTAQECWSKCRSQEDK